MQNRQCQHSSLITKHGRGAMVDSPMSTGPFSLWNCCIQGNFPLCPHPVMAWGNQWSWLCPRRQCTLGDCSAGPVQRHGFGRGNAWKEVAHGKNCSQGLASAWAMCWGSCMISHFLKCFSEDSWGEQRYSQINVGQRVASRRSCLDLGRAFFKFFGFLPMVVCLLTEVQKSEFVARKHYACFQRITNLSNCPLPMSIFFQVCSHRTYC